MACLIRLSNCSMTGVISFIMEGSTDVTAIGRETQTAIPSANALSVPQYDQFGGGKLKFFLPAQSVTEMADVTTNFKKKHPKRNLIVQRYIRAFSRQKIWAFNALDSIKSSIMHPLNGSR